MPDTAPPKRMSRQYLRLTEDRHQQALYRLAAVSQYLYDTMNGNADSDRPEPDPLPWLSMEKVREAQVAIDAAIKNGQRTRRICLAGQIELIEQQPPPLPKAVRIVRRGPVRVAWVRRRRGSVDRRFGFRRHPVGGFYLDLRLGAFYVRRAA